MTELTVKQRIDVVRHHFRNYPARQHQYLTHLDAIEQAFNEAEHFIDIQKIANEVQKRELENKDNQIAFAEQSQREWVAYHDKTEQELQRKQDEIAAFLESSQNVQMAFADKLKETIREIKHKQDEIAEQANTIRLLEAQCSRAVDAMGEKDAVIERMADDYYCDEIQIASRECRTQQWNTPQECIAYFEAQVKEGVK